MINKLKRYKNTYLFHLLRISFHLARNCKVFWNFVFTRYVGYTDDFLMQVIVAMLVCTHFLFKDATILMTRWNWVFTMKEGIYAICKLLIIKKYSLFCTAHLLLRITLRHNCQHLVKILTGRLKRLRKAAFALNKFLGPAKTTFNGKNWRYIQTRPSPFAEIDPLRLKLCLYRLIANKRARWPPIFLIPIKPIDPKQ